MVLAVFAGLNKSYGQLYDVSYIEGASAACTPAVPLTCASSADPLHPLPGEVYTYTVEITAATGTTPTIHWFVTDNPNFIATNGALTTDIDLVDGSYVLTASGSYNSTTNTSNTVDISWK